MEVNLFISISYKKYPLHYPYFSLMFNKVHFLELMSVRYPWEKTDKVEKG